VVPVTRMPREPWLTQVRAAQREEVVSNARQIGTALMMYVQDYDETFPPAGSGVADQLGPYVRNREVFNSPGQDSPGFVYVYNSNTVANIKEPASTVVGYLPGPGGRATLYADGHVRWLSDGESAQR
jgi:prepilin-type processing-associated H-X9-DG protein